MSWFIIVFSLVCVSYVSPFDVEHNAYFDWDVAENDLVSCFQLYRILKYSTCHTHCSMNDQLQRLFYSSKERLQHHPSNILRRGDKMDMLKYIDSAISAVKYDKHVSDPTLVIHVGCDDGIRFVHTWDPILF